MGSVPTPTVLIFKIRIFEKQGLLGQKPGLIRHQQPFSNPTAAFFQNSMAVRPEFQSFLGPDFLRKYLAPDTFTF